jgi:hypothetical protein
MTDRSEESWERHSPEWRVNTANREIGVPGMEELYCSWQWLDFHT